MRGVRVVKSSEENIYGGINVGDKGKKGEKKPKKQVLEKKAQKAEQKKG